MGFKSDDACLAKVADDEPIFVLRAQDRLAPRAIREWADRAIEQYFIQRGSDNSKVDPAFHRKITEARALADAMEAWQQRTGRAKYPD